MTGDLFINGKDAWVTWGVNMGEDFLEALLTPSPMKAYIENKSRLENGKQVDTTNAKVDERDVQVTITLEGSTQTEYLSRYESFVTELYKGPILMKVPTLRKIYKLTYDSSPTKMGNYGLCFGKFTLKFNEPNPTDRNII